jgi:nicotinamidase/pyrazinamidase
MKDSITLQWTGERPEGTDAAVIADIAASLGSLKAPEDLLYHTVFLGGDMEKTPGVIVEGEHGNPNFICTYHPAIGDAFETSQPNLDPDPAVAVFLRGRGGRKAERSDEDFTLGHNALQRRIEEAGQQDKAKDPDMTRKKTALLIVDVQNGFCPGGNLPVAEGDQIVPVINALIGTGYYDLVVLSQDWHPAGHGSFASTHGAEVFSMGRLGGEDQVMWPDHCVQGTYDAEFHPGLDLSKVAFIQQKGQDPEVDSYSAFRDNAADKKTGLDAWIAEQNVGQLDVCGLATDYCVKFSALDARDMLPGVDVRFLEEASRGISPEGVAAAIAEMEAAGIQIAASTYVVGAEGGNV